MLAYLRLLYQLKFCPGAFTSCPVQHFHIFGTKLLLLPVQVDASGSSLGSDSGGVSTPPASSNHNLEENQLLATPSSSAAPEPEGRSTEPEAGSGRVSPSDPRATPHKDFHCAVLKALSDSTDMSEHDQPEQDSQAEGSLVCHLPALAWHPSCPL